MVSHSNPVSSLTLEVDDTTPLVPFLIHPTPGMFPGGDDEIGAAIGFGRIYHPVAISFAYGFETADDVLARIDRLQTALRELADMVAAHRADAIARAAEVAS